MVAAIAASGCRALRLYEERFDDQAYDAGQNQRRHDFQADEAVFVHRYRLFAPGGFFKRTPGYRLAFLGAFRPLNRRYDWLPGRAR